MALPLTPPTRVLLIEQDPAARTTMAAALELAGYAVTAIAPPGSAAEAIAAAGDVAAAIIDCSAPLDAQAALATDLSLAGVRVVALIVPGPLTTPTATASAPVLFLSKSHWPAHLVPAVQAILVRNEEAANLRTTNEQLARALTQGREINVVVGILMERFHLDRAGAFELLRGEARARRMRLDVLAQNLIGAEERLHSLSGSGEQRARLRG
jgi:response regulator NasT